MMLRWISDEPPATVFAKVTKKLVTHRPASCPLSSSVTAPNGPQISMPSSNAALPASDVAIFMYECSGADEPCANDAKP